MLWDSSDYTDEPCSTCAPPLSSSGLTSFQNTIRIWPSLAVRVIKTSPSFSISSMAAGASFQESLRVRTEIPPPLRVNRWISVKSCALLRKLKSCYTQEREYAAGR
jgi:hypothetical protein